MYTMSNVIEYINVNLNSGLLSFVCIASGIIKAFGEIITAKMVLVVVLESRSVFQFYPLTNIPIFKDYANQLYVVIDHIFDKKFTNYENLMKLLLLFICLDLLITYVIQMICDNIADTRFKDMDSYLNENISDFFYRKRDFIDFIVNNLAVIIRGNHQFIETLVRNVSLIILLFFNIRILDSLCIILYSIFIICILVGHIVQYKFNKVNLIINVKKSGSLVDFIKKYKSLSEFNYLLIAYGLMCLLYGLIFYVLISWKMDDIKYIVNEKNKNKYIKLIIIICAVVLVRMGINFKISRMPLYLKRLSEMIIMNLSSVVISKTSYIENTNDYFEIFTDNLSITIDYDGEIVYLIKNMSNVFQKNKLYLISTDNIGKTVILKTLFTQFCNNDNVYYVNKNGKYSINDIKNIKNTSLFLDNRYVLKDSVRHIYDFLMDVNYYSLVKRIKLCKIMEVIDSDNSFVGIDNEMFIDFSNREILRILNYISKHAKDKLLFICVDSLVYSDNSLFNEYECYDIIDGSLVKLVN